jgi:hypothetical protein
MAKFDPARNAHALESIEPATDPNGKVIGYYGKTSNSEVEVFLSEEFIREHFTVAPKVIPSTASVMAAKDAAAKKPDPAPAK